MTDRAPEEVIEEPGTEDVVVADYVVHGPAGAITITAIADLAVGEHGELVLAASDGGCAGIWAPGRWWHVRVAAEG